VIIRIATEGQYKVKGSALARLDELDDAVLDAIEAGDEKAFAEAFAAVVELIRTQGVPLADSELEESDLILPPPDTTLEEARELFVSYPRNLS